MPRTNEISGKQQTAVLPRAVSVSGGNLRSFFSEIFYERGGTGIAVMPVFALVFMMFCFIASATAQTSSTELASGTSPQKWGTCPVSPAAGRKASLMSAYGVYRPDKLRGGGWHKGIDIEVRLDGERKEGDSLIATESGTASVSTSPGDKAGWHVILSADSGHVYYYAHLFDMALRERFVAQIAEWNKKKEEDPNYEPDDYVHSRVQKGNIIGKLGTTGSARRPHLHFDFKRNSYYNYVDPLPFIRLHCQGAQYSF